MSDTYIFLIVFFCDVVFLTLRFSEVCSLSQMVQIQVHVTVYQPSMKCSPAFLGPQPSRALCGGSVRSPAPPPRPGPGLGVAASTTATRPGAACEAWLATPLKWKPRSPRSLPSHIDGIDRLRADPMLLDSQTPEHAPRKPPVRGAGSQ